MSQTRYKRPYNKWIWLASALAFLASYICLLFIVGWTWYVWLNLGSLFVVLFFGAIFDPYTVRYKKHLEDGTLVRVKRPIVGFKRYETHFGLTGGYEVSADGWRYEKALWVVHFRPLEVVWCGEEWSRGQFTWETTDEDLF